jgi:site-specific DNA-methyltransferase (adenine-specific)
VVYFQNNDTAVFNESAFYLHKHLEEKSVDMCITSPPYWGLRRYIHKSGFVELGMESNFNDYIDSICLTFDRVKTVLKDTGSLYVNIGDTYFSTSKGTGGKSDKQDSNTGSRYTTAKFDKLLPEGQLVGIPILFCKAMVDRGWILINDIIWHKPNQMPTSAKRRFTQDFEHIFFFVKNMDYYFEQQFEEYKSELNRWGGTKLVAKGKSEWDKGTGQDSYRTRELRPNPNGRNKRCVWSIPTNKTYKVAHFATFPPDLVVTPILASCPSNGIVLDPFAGSGTVGYVCKELGRKSILFDTNTDYCRIMKERLE